MFVPSPQQAEVFRFVSEENGNAFIEAVAGAGKTTTLVEACKLMQGSSVAFAAYNKKIADAVDQIISEFGCSSLPLTVTYRCPKAVVTAAQGYVSHITAHETAPEGEFSSVTFGEFSEEIIPILTADDAVICRLTKPLIELAYNLIRRGIPCHVEGRDIGAGLLNIVNRWKVVTTDAFLNRLETWETKQTEKLIAKGEETKAEGIRDRCDTLRILCEGCADLDCVRTKIESLFYDTNGGDSPNLTLSTVHKAKGREWNTAAVLNFSTAMPSRYARLPWQMEQERNLIYVAFTRAKDRLILAG